MNIIKRIEILLRENVLMEDISTWTRAIRFYKKKKKNKVKCSVEKDSKGYFIMTHFGQPVVEIGLSKTDNKYPVYMSGKMASKTYFSDKEEADKFAEELEKGINNSDAVGINNVLKKMKEKYNI